MYTYIWGLLLVGLSGRLCPARAGGELLVCISIRLYIYIYVCACLCMDACLCLYIYTYVYGIAC